MLLHCGLFAENIDIFLEKNYEGGKHQFYDKVSNNLRYPQSARIQCKIGVLVTKLEIEPNSKNVKIVFLNTIGYGVESNVEDVLEMTNGNWIVSNEKRSVEITIGYRIGENKEIQADILMTASPVNPNTGTGCKFKESKELLRRITTYMKKGKYKKAKKICKELLSRNPRSEHYNGINNLINSKM